MTSMMAVDNHQDHGTTLSILFQNNLETVLFATGIRNPGDEIVVHTTCSPFALNFSVVVS
jgi:hypothetical protein